MVSMLTAEALFDDSKNLLPFSGYSPNSTKSVFWVCDKGHEWEQPFRSLLKSRGCQVCSGRKILPGFNDLATLHPSLAEEFAEDLNFPATQKDFSLGSNIKVWWRCSVSPEHTWQATVTHRVSGRNCPVCAGKKTVEGDNDFRSVHPHLAREIHPSRNNLVVVSSLTKNSGKVIWWVCEEGHEWEDSVDRRVRGGNCPVCKQIRMVSVADTGMMKYWDYQTNVLLPSEVSQASKKQVHWVCSKSHVWVKSPAKQRRNNHCPVCDGRTVLEGYNDLATTHPVLAAQFHPEKNTGLTVSELSRGSERKVWWLGECGHSWEAAVNNRVAGNGCYTCWQQDSSSTGEKDLASWLNSLGFRVETNTRDVISPKEMDVYLPDEKFGVEFNGVYWHSESGGKDRTYHYSKWLAAKEVGIQLVQVWQDDWNRNPELVKRMLAHKLGVSDERKVFARKTLMSVLDKTEAEQFLAENHIQGHSNGSYYLGLRDIETGETVAVLVLKKEPGTDGRTLNIVRYATSVNVVGGFTKLLTHAERVYKPESFVTFADHGVSDGGLYENNGFLADKEIPPDYMYVVKGERKHKFGYRLKKFKNDPNLKYEEGLSERELALLNNLPRVWDAGKTRYVKKVALSS